MRINLPAMAGNRRAITFRPIITTQAQAQSLAMIYLSVVKVWQEAIPSILQGYTVDGLTRDNAGEMQSAIDRAEGEASRLVLTVAPKIRDWAIRVEKWHREKWIGAVKTATNVDLSTVLTALEEQETLSTFLARNAALVKGVSDQARNRISETVFREYQKRTPIRDVAKQLNEATGLGKKRSIRIAQDQTVKLAAALDRDRQTDAGITQFKWRHSGKLHPRETHKARDGIVYSWKAPPADLPGELPYCGCRAQAYLPIMDELK